MTSILSSIQMRSSNDVDENLRTATLLIKEAAFQKSDLVVLPEMFAIMGKTSYCKVQHRESFSASEKIQAFLSDQARKYQMWIVGGTIPIACDNPNKVRAASLVFNHLGDCVGRYDKIHLFDATLSEKESYRESETTEAGDTACVIDTPFGKIGIAVCFDLRFPELFHQLYQLGAEIIVVPSAFTVPTGRAHFEILMRCRAIDCFAYLIGACQGGKHANDRETFGHSMIVSPWGDILCEKIDDVPGVISTTIDLQKVHQARVSIPRKYSS